MKKILYIDNMPEPNGCTLYRNIIPAEGLETLGWQINFLPIRPDRFDFDIVNFSRMYQLTGIKKIIEMLKEKSDVKITFDTDDLIDHIAPDNPFQSEYNKKELIGGYHYLIDNADLVTVTTEYLKNEVAKRRNKPIVVVPNSVREFTMRDGKEKKVRICYTGSSSHYLDFNFFLDIILELQKKYDFEFISQGMGIDEQFEKAYKYFPAVMKPYFECKEKLLKVKNYKRQENVHCFEYQETLRKMDVTIGVCPLHDDKFTKCKSAIKYYDWASVGTVTLAQDCVVYQDCNYTAKKYSEWKNKLERLIIDAPFRNEVLVGQMNYVYNKRCIDQVKYKWDEVFSELLV